MEPGQLCMLVAGARVLHVLEQMVVVSCPTPRVHVCVNMDTNLKMDNAGSVHACYGCGLQAAMCSSML